MNARKSMTILMALGLAVTVFAGDDEFEALEHAVYRLAVGKAKLSLKEAATIAAKEAGDGQLVDAELGVDGVTPVFEFGFVNATGGVEITVDAVAGKVLKKEQEKPEGAEADESKALQKALSASKFTLMQAIDAAANELKGGTMVAAGAEVEDGKLEFEVEAMMGEEFKAAKFGAEGKLMSTDSEKAEGQAWTFDKDETGKPPAGWKFGFTNPTDGKATWTVAQEPKAVSGPNVLSLDAKSGGNVFNLAMAEKTSYQNVDVRTRIRANTGKEDQGGGLIWRAKDENNYYICRINPLENNFRVYKVVNGKRQQLQGVDQTTETGKWHVVRAKMVGSHLQCYVDGKKLLDSTDDTFKDAGMVGLWTKADASSSFDNIAVKPGKTSKDDQAAAKPADTGKKDADEDDDDDDDDQPEPKKP